MTEHKEILVKIWKGIKEHYETGELKQNTGLNGTFSEFGAVKRKAEEMGLIYCYSKNVGFATAEEYCKQAEVVS